MDALELAKQAKKQNIIDMAVGVSAMTPFFQERSANLIKEKLADLFEGLENTGDVRDIWTFYQEQDRRGEKISNGAMGSAFDGLLPRRHLKSRPIFDRLLL